MPIWRSTSWWWSTTWLHQSWCYIWSLRLRLHQQHHCLKWHRNWSLQPCHLWSCKCQYPYGGRRSPLSQPTCKMWFKETIAYYNVHQHDRLNTKALNKCQVFSIVSFWLFGPWAIMGLADLSCSTMPAPHPSETVRPPRTSTMATTTARGWVVYREECNVMGACPVMSYYEPYSQLVILAYLIIG